MVQYRYEFDVEMTCEGCSGAVERVLGKLGDQVSDLKIDLPNKKVFVTSGMDADAMIATLQKTGKTVKLVETKQL